MTRIILLPAVLVAIVGCRDTQEAEPVGGPEPAGPPALERADDDEQELAHRLGAPDLSRGPVGRPPPSHEPMLRDADTAGDGGALPPRMVDRWVSGDMQSFERRLKEELADEGLALAGVVDLEQQPRMRLFIITPGPSFGGEEPHARAEAALQHARLIVAHREEGRPDLVHAAYLLPQCRAMVMPQPSQYDLRVDAAFHRAVGD